MSKPTVTFITPPSPFLLDERVFPSLGILKVAAAVERAGWPVEHLDLNGVSNFTDPVIAHCANVGANEHVFAITATTPQMVAATKIRDSLRWCGAGRIIIGGPHPTLVNAACKTGSIRSEKALDRLLNDYDTVICGDGEMAMIQALMDETIKLIDADDPKSPLFLKSSEMGDLPFPARHLVEMESYHYTIDDRRVTSMINQLGCPFGCNFCTGRDSAMLRRVRLRPTETVLAEMEHIFRTYGIHGFMMFDDELNVNRQFMELLRGMCDLQERLGVEFRCRGFVKSELFTEEQAEWMYRAGFRRVMCGFESGSDRILKNINKRATKDDNTRAMELSHKYSLDMKALMSVGHPGESQKTIKDTMDWLLAVRPADFDCTIITAYPGSPYYDRAIHVKDDTWVFETNGDNLYMQDIDYTQVEDFYKGSLSGYKSYVWTDYLKPHHLVDLRGIVESTVRKKLGIPFYKASPAQAFEASMGQLPGMVYRKGKDGKDNKPA